MYVVDATHADYVFWAWCQRLWKAGELGQAMRGI